MTIPHNPNTLKLTFDLIPPDVNNVNPKLRATVINTDTILSQALTKDMVLINDPVSAVIAWLLTKSITITNVTYYDNTWYLATNYTGVLPA
jgi:alanine-alpha-ketoisovalerate/valine-pyruvate aminotransferase